jgi:hypothetical protein
VGRGVTIDTVNLVPAARLADRLADSALQLGEDGTPLPDVVLVDLDDVGDRRGLRHELPPTCVVLGVASRRLSSAARIVARDFACTYVPAGAAESPVEVGAPDPHAAAGQTADAVRAAPRAAVSLVNLLRNTGHASISEGLVAESAVYSMLLAGGEFARWLASRPRHAPLVEPQPAVLVERTGPVLDVTLNRPHRRNAFDRAMRDGLIAAFDVALADPSVEQVLLRGAGASFCSGGDLAEFGTSADVSTAHLIRLDRSVALRIDRCQARVVALLHGACIGAGIEIPSFAGRVLARPDAFFQLPEVGMGLVPGAGGTVGITRRIGRWRTAHLALSGARVDAVTALDWGLIDAIAGE